MNDYGDNAEPAEDINAGDALARIFQNTCHSELAKGLAA